MNELKESQITPVLRIETYTLPEQHPITERLRQLLRSIMLGEDQQYAEWLTVILLEP